MITYSSGKEATKKNTANLYRFSSLPNCLGVYAMDSQILLYRLSRKAEEALTEMQTYADGQLVSYWNPDALIESVNGAIWHVWQFADGSKHAGYCLSLQCRFSQLKPLVKLYYAKSSVRNMWLYVSGYASCFPDPDLVIMCAERAIQQAAEVGNDVAELSTLFVTLKEQMVIICSSMQKKS